MSDVNPVRTPHMAQQAGKAVPYLIVKSVVADDGTRIDLRFDTLDDDDLVLIHMGAGAVENAARAALLNYDSYRGLESENGLFCVSVFGLTHGVTKTEIFSAMKHGQYGEARYGDIKSLVRVLPTSIVSADMTSEMTLVQTSHFDLVLNIPDQSRVDASRIEELDKANREKLLAQLSEALKQVLRKFEPRKPREERRA